MKIEIYAGDQIWEFCDQVGLRHIDDKNQHTWKADCNPMGKKGHRGDIICASKNVIQLENPQILIPYVHKINTIENEQLQLQQSNEKSI